MVLLHFHLLHHPIPTLLCTDVLMLFPQLSVRQYMFCLHILPLRCKLSLLLLYSLHLPVFLQLSLQSLRFFHHILYRLVLMMLAYDLLTMSMPRVLHHYHPLHRNGPVPSLYQLYHYLYKCFHRKLLLPYILLLHPAYRSAVSGFRFLLFLPELSEHLHIPLSHI